MLSRPKYDENGKKVLCEMGGVNSEMNMDIYVKKLAAGEVLDICEDKNECAVLLLSGKVHFEVGEINEICQRENPFEKKPYAVHFSRGTAAHRCRARPGSAGANSCSCRAKRSTFAINFDVSSFISV